MALAVHAASEDRVRRLFGFLLVTVFFWACFLAVKGLEYHEDLKEQLWPGPHFRAGLPRRRRSSGFYTG